MKFFDAHTHVQFAAFNKDYKEVIKRALREGIGMINVGTQKYTSRRAVEIAHEFSVQDESTLRREENGVYATVGLHPIHTENSYYDSQELDEPFSNSCELENNQINRFISHSEVFDYKYYKKLALDSKVVAIGECGLDYTAFIRRRNERQQKQAPVEVESEDELSEEKTEEMKTKQQIAFIEQIKLAYEIKKPLMIHCRNAPSIRLGHAFSDLIKILTTHCQLLITNNPGIIHFFSGSKKEAKKLLEIGFSFTFGGVITFARDYDEIIKMLPLDRILSETDAPYVAPVPYRGKRNEPVYVIEVVKKLAEIKNVPLEKMIYQISENARKIFGIVF